MSWKNLKTFAIIVLLIMNVFFGTEVYRQYKRMNYYSEKEISSVTELLSESGIYVNEDILRAKKLSIPAYMRTSSDVELLSALRLFGNVSRSGEKYIVSNGYKTWSFGNDGSFEYRSAENVSMPVSLIESGTVSAVFMIDEYTERLEAAMNGIICFDNINALPANKGAKPSHAELYRLYTDRDTGYYVAMFLQYTDKMQTSQAFYLLIDENGEVLSGEGSISLLLPNEKLKTDCVDLLTVFFDEKRWADAYFSSGKTGRLLLSELYYSYDIYRLSDGSEYYVPTVNLIYSDGTVHSYNMIDGIKK